MLNFLQRRKRSENNKYSTHHYCFTASRMVLNFYILLICVSTFFLLFSGATSFNLSLPHQHLDPEAVAHDVQWWVSVNPTL